MEIRKISRRPPRSEDDKELGLFTLFAEDGSLNLLFVDVLVAIVVVICLSSLIFGSWSGRRDLEPNIFPSGPPTQSIST